MEKVLIPFVSIKPTHATIYCRLEGSGGSSISPGVIADNSFNSKTEIDQDNEKRPGQEKAATASNVTGFTLSEKSRKKLTTSINWLTLYSQKKKVYHADKKHSFKFKVNFVTLTLPTLQRHFDTTIKKKLLNGFLTELREKYQVRNYAWRAECQKNGSIHFHIITDSFINAFALRRLWNKKLELLGYISGYKEKFQDLDYSEYCEILNCQNPADYENANRAYAYGKKTNWNNPNTTDVHSVSKIKNLAAYVSKYMAKRSPQKTNNTTRTVQDRRLSGRLWGCSTSLSRLKTCVDFYSGNMQRAIDKAIDSRKYHVIKEKYFTCVCIAITELIALNKSFFGNYLVDFAKEMDYRPVQQPPKGYYFDKSLYYDIPSIN